MRCARWTFVVVAAWASTGCATASLDLERARRHYLEHDHFAALALLRLLGEDEEALAPAERAQWAYLRGMTDRRIADGLPPRERDARDAFYACSRDWLTRALASAAGSGGGGLDEEQRARARETLASTPPTTHAPGACGG
jgi:hypothetical protein